MNRALVFASMLCGGLAACGDVTTNGNDNPPPLIEQVTPDRGGLPGGHEITVSGSGFVDDDAGDNFVVVGDRTATDVTAVDDSTLTFRLPPGPAPGQKVDLLVFNSNGFALLPDAIEYNPTPAITSLSTDHVRSAGEDRITIFGAGFEELDAGENRVFLGPLEADSVDVVSDTELEVTTTTRTDDVAAFTWLDVRVENGNGVAVLPASIRYTKPGFLVTSNNQVFLHSIFYVGVDGDDVEIVELAQLVSPVHGMAEIDGTIYATAGRCNSGPRLVTFDPFTGAMSTIGILQDDALANGTIQDIAAVDGVLYGHSNNNNQLVSIDHTTGTWTLVGLVAVDDGTLGSNLGIGITPGPDGKVFLAEALNGQLRLQSVADSTVTDQVLMTGSALTGVHGLARDGDDLLAATRENPDTGALGSWLVRIDPEDGSVDTLAKLPGVIGAIIATPASF